MPDPEALPSFTTANPPLQKDEIYREVITIRKTTETRVAIRLTIRQGYAPSGELALASVTLTGKIDKHIESPRFMRDFGEACFYAAHVMDKLNTRVNGAHR